MNASLIKEKGVMKLSINGRILDPVAYRSFWPQPWTVRGFADHGFALYGVFPTGIRCSLDVAYSQFGEVWTGDGEYDWDNLKAQADLFVNNAPEGYFQLMVHLDTRDWFLRDHPGCADSFNELVNTAGYTLWRESAARFMCDMIDWLDEHYPERVCAVFLFAGGTCEWYTRHASADGPHPLKEQAYRQWTGDAEAVLPDVETLSHTADGVLRHPRQDAEALRYWHFHNELVADTIGWFAARVKEHTGGTRLVGVFYGYLTAFGSAAALHNSHNALTRVLRDPNVDIMFSPASYALRSLSGPSAFLVPIDSLRLHGKLYYHEIDNTTHLANSNYYARRLQQYAHKRMNTMAETVMYSRRESALALSKGAGYWWFDMFSGWYDDAELMDELEKIRRVTEMFYEKDMSSVSEVAFFVDEESNYFAGPDSGLSDALVRDQMDPLGRMGLPWDCYEAGDLRHPRMPHDQYRLYIFANLFSASAGIRETVAALRARGKSMLFLYAPGYIGGEGFDIAAMEELTGMAFTRVRDSGRIIVPPGPLNEGAEELVFGFPRPTEPLFSPQEQGLEIAGRYQSGRAALALRSRERGFDAFCGAGPIPAGVLRALALRAGAFAYTSGGDPVYINGNLLGMFCHEGGDREIRFPSDCVLTEVYTGETVPVRSGRAALRFYPDEMKLFRIGR